MSRRKKIPREPVEAKIDSLSHEGRGVCRINGKTVFVDGALAGENVKFSYRRSRRSYAEGVVEEVIADASADRVEPACAHASICGGCSLQHLSASAQIQHKQNVLLEQLKHIGEVEPESLLEPLTGESWGYRRKARLGVKHVQKKEKVLVGFREKHSAYIADIQSCKVLHASVGDRLMDLASLVESLSIYNKVAQIEVAIDDQQTALIFRNLETPSATDLEKLDQFGEDFDMKIYLQPGGPTTVTSLPGQEDSQLHYLVDDGNITIHFSPADFTQVNSGINRAMIDRVIDLLAIQSQESLLDLFCGLGNFTLPLARRAARVIGIEGAESLVNKARDNAGKNDIDNVEFHVADLFACETEPEYLGGGYQKMLLDPPRSGAEQVVQSWKMRTAEKIVYVSCNPATLSRDAGILVNKRGFHLKSVGVMDMFPHTSHVESVAVFERD